MAGRSISVVVPAFNRPSELGELLDSVLAQGVLPDEVLICEDNSPQRAEIRSVCEEYADKFSEKGIRFNYVENEDNLGYDKNLRKCLESACSDWALILGNDDILLPDGIRELRKYISENSVDFVSRAFVRFNISVTSPLGVSSISDHDVIFSRNNAPPRMIFRAAGFVGGLAVRTEFARRLSTDEFDGGLYYQIYLAAVAFCEEGIGYISSPIVGGRADNPPMFGSSASDSDVHVPGSYTAKGRARMWKAVLQIVERVGFEHNLDLRKDIKRELTVRQSFHVFEMNAKSSRSELKNLKTALSELGLFSHPLPITLYWLDYLFGRRATVFYKLCRKLIQS